ncbi:hypothetical protein BDF22DRAFT_110007 [Syncephalis plumigaleata]|nr:hypothetical protein BDF22DRAFT_110007 [Syncephalis plumigaleata]
MSSLATFASASTPTSSIAPPPVSFYFQVLPPSLNDDDYEGFATLPGESILLMKRNVGLYLGKVRCQDFDDGIVYLTSQRIVYIDIQRPLNKRFALSLTHIERIDGFVLLIHHQRLLFIFSRMIIVIH